MVSLQKIIEYRTGDEQELKFFTHSIQCLSAMTQYHIPWKCWMITSFDVEYGREIGSGG